MVIRRKSRIMNLNTPMGIWILAVASALAAVAVVVTLSPKTVQADVQLARPAATLPPVPSVAIATQAMPAPHVVVGKHRTDILHGLASWYGSVFNGRLTASGEKFDMFAMTACHPTLPFGSIVRVFNRSNKRSVVVRITDRGDLVDEGRVIDLSYGAAEKLAMTDSGLAKVDLQVISLGSGRGK
jgi:rare lipoprotein A